MSSRDGALPAGSSWKLTARFRYPRRGPYGIGFGIADSEHKDKRPFWSHYDDNLKLPRLLMGEHEVLVQNPAEWHDISVCNNHGHWNVDLDGIQVLTADCGKADYTVYFGGDVPSIKPWAWTTLALQSVRIEYTEGPRPPWLADLLETQQQVASAAAAMSEAASVVADLLKTQPSLAGKLPVSPSNTGGMSVLPEIAKRISSLGLALGVDSRIQAPAFPAPDGHLVVTARTTVLQLQRGSIVEYRPQLNRPDYTPAVLHLVVNHRIVESKDAFFTRTNRSLPSFVVDAPTTGTRSTLVSIVAEDVNQRQIELSSSTLELAGSDAPNSFVLQDEKVRLTATKAQTPKAVYAFLENEYLGCLKVNLEAFAVDARHLPVGQHRFWLITESSDGALHPPTDSTITILPRFKMSSFAQEGTFTVDADKQSYRYTSTGKLEPA